jgi:hypothetical protein
MPGAFIGKRLSASERRDLSEKLAPILPRPTQKNCGTDQKAASREHSARIDAFLNAAEHEIDFYYKLLVPLHRDLSFISDDLRRLADIGSRFAKIVKTINPQTLSSLKWRLDASTELNVVRQFEPVLRLARDVPHAEDLLKLLRQPWPLPLHIAGFWAAAMARDAETLLKRLSSSDASVRPGPSAGGDAAVIGLVRHLANAYAEIFGQRPAVSRGGHFAQALAIIFQECDVRDPDGKKLEEIGESRLGKIMRGHSSPQRNAHHKFQSKNTGT